MVSTLTASTSLQGDISNFTYSMPTSEEHGALVFLKDVFYQGRDALARHKDKVEVVLAQMEDTMSTNPASTSL